MRESLLPIADVIRRVGFGRSTIYARIAAGTFPRPRAEPGTGSVRWLESEVDAWVADWISRSAVAGTLAGSRAERVKKAA